MATADQLKALLNSHSEGDDVRFYAVAMQVAAAEAKKGHADFASELRALIDRAKGRKGERTQEFLPLHIAAPRGELADLLAVFHPQTRLPEIVLEEVLHARLERILREQRHIVKLKSHGLHARQRLLLTGPPGCGKTMTASVLAGELGIPLFVVRLDGLITRYMGETTAKLRLIFDAIERTRAVYLFDEFDSIGTQRGSGNDVGEIRRVLNSFLMFIEQHTSTSLLIAATNHPQSLDSALFRRFDDLLEFHLPARALIERTLEFRLANFGTGSQLDLSGIAGAAEGLSYAEIVRACDEAVKEMLIHDREGLLTEDLQRSIHERKSFLQRSGSD